MGARVLQGYFRAGGLGAVAQPKAGTIQRKGNAQQLPEGMLKPGAGGRPLPEAVRTKMESFFKADLSDVRVHVGSEAASIGALAFTLGSNLYFAPGQLDMHSQRGHELLGHELAHVIQQRAGRVQNPFGNGVAVVQDPALEAEADRMGRLAAAHRATSVQKKETGKPAAARHAPPPTRFPAR
jgi:hypothetical protein